MSMKIKSIFHIKSVSFPKFLFTLSTFPIPISTTFLIFLYHLILFSLLFFVFRREKIKKLPPATFFMLLFFPVFVFHHA